MKSLIKNVVTSIYATVPFWAITLFVYVINVGGKAQE